MSADPADPAGESFRSRCSLCSCIVAREPGQGNQCYLALALALNMYTYMDTLDVGGTVGYSGVGGYRRIDYSFVDIDIIFAFNYMNIKNGSVEHMCPQSGADPCADQ